MNRQYASLNKQRSTVIALATFAMTFLANMDSMPVFAAEPAAKPIAAPLHCQVPCGIYGDQLRFEAMLEDTKTIAKAIDSIKELAGKMAGGTIDATTLNQSARWVVTKEDHANKIQNTIAEYFLAQRIKSDHPQYTGQLATAHRVIVAAMKAKQDANPETATALKEAIHELYRAYEGKEPVFESDGQ